MFVQRNTHGNGSDSHPPPIGGALASTGTSGYADGGHQQGRSGSAGAASPAAPAVEAVFTASASERTQADLDSRRPPAPDIDRSWAESEWLAELELAASVSHMLPSPATPLPAWQPLHLQAFGIPAAGKRPHSPADVWMGWLRADLSRPESPAPSRPPHQTCAQESPRPTPLLPLPSLSSVSPAAGGAAGDLTSPTRPEGETPHRCFPSPTPPLNPLPPRRLLPPLNPCPRPRPAVAARPVAPSRCSSALAALRAAA